eukprot:CAMPEP_0206299768 /NCGR_PEP_ID=MMETSP0106_2-20121207/7356_1 /ASSEMBLY_ACC=CAM_ASM_000206 /TAXON_ID=81532 /ORGANISM="Acanthoeca-like sp., Strain 10tr" /LENGTH=130 /DNA_ID=CAMNT_0053730471 /DNA_START=293 /DNA_END=681 /DNA_ORIENTATION=-
MHMARNVMEGLGGPGPVTPMRINVPSCLRDVNVLLGSPIRSGQRFEIRLSLSPRGRGAGEVGGGEVTTLDFAPEPASQETILDITVELLLHILNFVPPESLGRLRRVCKGWKMVVDTHKEALFRPHCLAR